MTTNRRKPPSSMPPPRGGEAQPNTLVEGLTLLAGLVGQALERGTTELSRSVRIPFAGGLAGQGDDPGMLDATLRVRTYDVASAAAAAAAQADPPAAKASQETAAATSRMRDPLVDVFDEGPEVIVAAEVPGCGIEDVDIEIDADGAALTLTASGARGYRRELTLPAAVHPTPIEKSCNNGVLNLRLGKRAARSAEDV